MCLLFPRCQANAALGSRARTPLCYCPWGIAVSGCWPRRRPLELEECASIDGASRYRIFWSIVLPLAVPGLVATFLFVLVFC